MNELTKFVNEGVEEHKYLILLILISYVLVATGAFALGVVVRKEIRESYQLGAMSIRRLPPVQVVRCTGEEAAKWWAGSEDMGVVRDKLCKISKST
jgi:hypothetical protein